MKYSAGTPIRSPASEGSPFRRIAGTGTLLDGGIPRVVAGHLAEEQGHIFGACGPGRPRVQRRAVSHQPVARNPPIGGLDAGHAAVGRRLADAAARIGAQSRRHHAGWPPPRPYPRSSRPAHAPGSRVMGGAVGRVLGGGAHGEFIGIGLAHDHHACLQQALDAGGGIGGNEVFQDARAAGAAARPPPRAHP